MSSVLEITPFLFNQLTPETIRKTAYNISIMSVYTDFSAQKKEIIHDLTQGTCALSAMIDLVIFAMKNRIIEYGENDLINRLKLERTINVLCLAQQYTQLREDSVLCTSEKVINETREGINKLKETSQDASYLEMLLEFYKLNNELHVMSKIATRELVIDVINEHLAKKPDEDLDIIFPGGALMPCHAIMYGIHKDKESDVYTFSIWNTGAGIHYHNHQDNKYEIKASWSHLTFEKICDPDFLESLFITRDVDELYTNLANRLERPMDPLSETSYLGKSQKYGNCEWKSLFASLADLLGRNENKTLALQIKADIINALRDEVLLKISPRTDIDHALISAAFQVDSFMDNKAILKCLQSTGHSRALSYTLLSKMKENYCHYNQES